MGQPVKLSWQPQYQDWAEVFAARRGPQHLLAKFAVLSAAFALLAVAGLWRGMTPLVAGGVVGVIVTWGMYALQPRFVRQFWNRTPSARSATKASIDVDGGIIVENSAGRSTVPWESVGLVQETDRVFVVHVKGSKACFPLAKRGVAQPADLERLRGLLMR